MYFGFMKTIYGLYRLSTQVELIMILWFVVTGTFINISISNFLFFQQTQHVVDLLGYNIIKTIIVL